MKVESFYVAFFRYREDGTREAGNGSRMYLNLQSEEDRARFLAGLEAGGVENVEAIAVDVIERRAA